MKKVIILLALLALCLTTFSCGGGGAGSADVPSGENPGVASVVQLLPSHFISQTNATITLHTKVLDGNGLSVPNTPVIFTNLSPIGVLSSTGANTDASGIATVTLKSTTSGFATVQAEVNTGAGQIRNRKTVYFAVNIDLTPFMYLDVDGDDDGDYDEDSDFILFENPNDNQVVVRATVFNRFGQRASGSVVTFGADWPYKIGSSATCSDGSSTCEVSFPLGNTATTDIYGQAFVLVRVDPITIRNITTILNITASADNGAANMVTLQLLPVTIDTVTVSAVPTVVESGGTSTITAAVTLNTGASAPDGTTVSFTTTCGTVTPFAQTTGGVATATFTAPEVTADTTATITASVGGKSDSVVVTITAPVTPPPTPTPDTTSPTVSSTIPANGDTGVAHPTPVTITFSENIDCSTVTSATVTITPSVTWNLTSCTGNTVVFNGATLANTSYTVNVGTGVKDLAGNVAVASVFSFTTEP